MALRSSRKAMFQEDGIDSYLREVSSFPVLTREEERELFQRKEAGDDAAREEIVRRNLRFVIMIALQYKGLGLPLGDLVQEGNIGLLTVVDKFDWRRGFRFSTYAAFWIRQEIQAAVRRLAGVVKLPVRKARLLGKINETIKSFSFREGREPNAEEIASELGVEEEAVIVLLPFREAALSLEAERNEDGSCLLDSMEQDCAPAPDAAIAREQTADVVRHALGYLNDREREVIELRYGFGENGRALSLRKASKLVGLSQEGVRRVERRALDKLQRPAIAKQLEFLLSA